MVSTPVKCSLLASMIWSLMTVLSANGQLDGAGQISINPQTGAPGDTFMGSCSSAAIGPGISLWVRWSVLMGLTERVLGECRSTAPGFPELSCDPGLEVDEPYQDGISPFAIVRVSYQAGAENFTLTCDTGSHEPLSVMPVLSGAVTREPMSTDAVTLPDDSALTLTVNGAECISGLWLVHSTSNIPVRRFDYETPLGIQMTTNPNIEFSDVFYIIPMFDVPAVFRVWPVWANGTKGIPDSYSTKLETSQEFYQPSCSGLRFFLAKYALLEHIVFRLFAPRSFNITVDVYTPVQVNVPLPHGSPLIPVVIARTDNCCARVCAEPFRLINSCSNAVYHDEELEPPCYGEKVNFTNYYVRGPENLTMGCLTLAGSGWSLTLHWLHLLLSPPAGDCHYQNMVYQIQVNSSLESQDYQTSIQLETPDAPEPGSNELFSRPQQFELPVEPGNRYQILITPEYPGLIEVDQDAAMVSNNSRTYEIRCGQQRLYHEIVIPPETEVLQELETVVLRTAGKGEYKVRILDLQGQQFGETYQDDGGTTDAHINTTTFAAGTYLAEVAYSGTAASPCRNETLTFTLPAPLVTTGKPVNGMIRRTTVQAATTTMLPTSVSTMLATSQSSDIVSTPYPGEDNQQPGSANLASYTGYGVFGVETLAIIGLSTIGITLCARIYQRNHAEP